MSGKHVFELENNVFELENVFLTCFPDVFLMFSWGVSGVRKTSGKHEEHIIGTCSRVHFV
jgi:hypothetical protein